MKINCWWYWGILIFTVHGISKTWMWQLTFRVYVTVSTLSLQTSNSSFIALKIQTKHITLHPKTFLKNVITSRGRSWEKSCGHWPDVNSRVGLGSHHGEGFPGTRLSVRHQADIVSVHTGSDNTLSVSKNLEEKITSNQIYIRSITQSQFKSALAHNMEIQGDFCPMFFVVCLNLQNFSHLLKFASTYFKKMKIKIAFNLSHSKLPQEVGKKRKIKWGWIFSCIQYCHYNDSHRSPSLFYLFLCWVRIVDFVKREHLLLLVAVYSHNVTVCRELETTPGPVVSPGSTEHADVPSQLL